MIKNLLLASSLAFCLTANADNVKNHKTNNFINVTDSSKIYDLDEISIVSQPKEYYRLRQQALSSSMFLGSQIESLHIDGLKGLTSFVPSLIIPDYGSRLTSAVYIRGIGSRINNPAVGMYIDGVPLMTKSVFNFHTYDINRIDVLRGPQGTLYGQNTEGGLIKVYTKNPLYYQGTDVKLSFSNDIGRRAEVSHYNKINDRFAFSVAGFYNGSNGFFTNTFTNSKADNFNEAGGRVRIEFPLTKKLSASYIADYQYVNQNGFPYGVINGETQEPNYNAESGYKRNMFNTSLTLSLNGKNVNFYSVSSYQYLKDKMLMDQDYLPVDYMRLQQQQMQNAITQEFVFKSKENQKWRWTTGVFGSYQWLKTSAPIYFGEGITAPIAKGINTTMYNAMVKSIAAGFVKKGMTQEQAEEAAKAMIEKAGGVSLNIDMRVPGVFRTPQFNLGFFHESSLEITPRLTATLGVRYDLNIVKLNYDTEAVMDMTANVMGKKDTYTLNSPIQDKLQNSYNQFLPKAGLSYRINSNGSNVYASVSKGYRSGGYNIQMFSDVLQTELMANARNATRGNYTVPHTEKDYENIANTIAYKPEISWNYEVGTHLNLFNNTMQLDLSAFYMQITNQQLSVMAGNYGFGRSMVNAGKSISCGGEMSLRGYALDNKLFYSATYSFTHAAFKEYSDTIVNGKNKMFVDYSKKKVPFVPMHSFSTMVQYTIPFATGIMKNLTFGIDFSGNGKIYWNESNTFEEPFYTTLGARAQANFGAVSVELWGKNLTNAKYNTFVVNSAATGKEYNFAQKVNPLQVGIDLKLHL